jgi:flavin-dependent dehydrogenase
MQVDVAIVGGGPAGLAVAIESARRGLATLLLERHAFPVDKACGEGLLPMGVRALEALGARALLSPASTSPLRGLRYIQEDGSAVEGRLPSPGLGIRRTELVTALAQQATKMGARLRERCGVRSCRTEASGVTLETDTERIQARVLVAADGLSSPLRRVMGLHRDSPGPGRYGLRQHFAVRPWTDFVEVYLSPVAEAYVTPCGEGRVGVAFLWEDGAVTKPIDTSHLLERFPLLAERLSGAGFASAPRGAGPFLQRTRGVVAPRFAAVGDAAGYVDAITGEGLSLGLEAARSLGAVLPDTVAHPEDMSGLLAYERDHHRLFRRYAITARSVLGLARRPRLRRAVVRGLRRAPKLFEALIQLAVEGPPVRPYLRR